MKKQLLNSGLSKIIFSLLLVITSSSFALAGFKQTQTWSTNPFDEKEIIENKGQFTSKYNQLNEPILYTINQGGVNIYFSATGITWRHDDVTMKEEEGMFKKKKAEEEEFNIKTNLLHMHWENSDPNVQVIGEDAFSYYRTYGDLSNPSTNTFKANVFKKIIYKNLYPNIDVEYFFPKDKSGIKYNVILHPGANASLLKMKYTNAKNTSTDANGNINITSAFGLITDHAPSSYDQNGQPVASAFQLKKNIVSFALQANPNSTITIDPWVTNPVFTTMNKAYDVDYDQYGNVFAYGGVNTWSPATSFELVKINSAGAIQWKYSTNLFSDQAPSPGDFFVDYNTGRSYIFEGENLGPPFNSGNNNSAEAIKLDAAGNLVKFYIPANPNQSMTEFSRVIYNCATQTVLAAGGGVAGCWQAATFDTSLTLMSYQNVLASQGVTNAWNNSYHDIALLASDNAGMCYMLANRSFVIDPLHADNYLFQAAMTTPQNNIWGVSSYHHFVEEGQGIPKKYGMSSSNIYLQNGYNGMAVNCNFLCTSDGHIMKKWDKNNGALLKASVISPDSLRFGGLDISHCDHIFAGYYNTIKIFDSNLNPVSSLATTDTVYDLKLDEFRKLVYAVGRGFVSAIAINENCLDNIFITSTGGACKAASATVQDTGTAACVSASQYSYVWSNGATTQTISNISPGNYSVTVNHSYMFSCHTFSWTDTASVTIMGGGNPPVITTNHTNATCANSSGSATAAVTSGNSPYTYSWFPSGGTTATASGLLSGTYTIIITDKNGCTSTDTVSVFSTGSITALVNSTTICSGQNANLSASGGTNYSWSNGATTASINPVVNAPATYSVIVSSGTCVDTAFASVAVNPSPTVSLGNDLTICSAQNLTLDAGNPGASYLWSNGAVTQTINVYGAGTYWVIVGLNNCLAKDTLKILTPPAIHLSDSSLCTVSPIILDPGSGATSYLWSDGSTSPTISVSTSGNYWVEVMYGNCKTTDTAKITGDGTDGGLYVPNAFTPNDDHLNEIFLAKGTGIISFDMKVFDRWGNLIFRSDDVSKGWDGKIQGGNYILKGDGEEASQEDVYVWKINYKTQCFPDRLEKKMGSVAIVK